MKKKTKKKHKLWRYILTLLIIGFAYLFVSILADMISAEIIENHITTEEVVITEETNIESILLATRLKLIEANVYIQVNYDNGYEIGSGVIIDEDELYYYAITNYHVIDGNNEIIDSKSVVTSDNISSDYLIVATDQLKDLALIKFDKENRDEFIPLNLNQSNIFNRDELVVSIGNPFGEIATVNYGSVIRMTYLQELEISHQVLEHNASLANGSSGGALVDMYGNLIGINTWELDNMYYAIPMSVINTFLE